MAETSHARAQFGEDLLLAGYFGEQRSGTYVEVGAHDGVTHSNTYYFEQLGWHGVLVEPDPEVAEECARNRPGSTVVQAAVVPPGRPAEVPFQRSELSDHSSLDFDARHRRKLAKVAGSFSVEEIRVPAKTLDLILEESGLARIDFLTVDVEGHEAGVLEGSDLARWKPRYLIIERNYIRPQRRVAELLRRSGYTYLQSSGCNEWFVPAEWEAMSWPRRAWARTASPIRQTFHALIHQSKRKAKRSWWALRASLARLRTSR